MLPMQKRVPGDFSAGQRSWFGRRWQSVDSTATADEVKARNALVTFSSEKKMSRDVELVKAVHRGTLSSTTHQLFHFVEILFEHFFSFQCSPSFNPTDPFKIPFGNISDHFGTIWTIADVFVLHKCSSGTSIQAGPDISR